MYHKQISDIHKSLFNNSIKTKSMLKEKKQALKSRGMKKNIEIKTLFKRV